MKTITKISMQQNGERYNLFLDEEFFCGISEDTLIKLGLKKGQQVDEADLEALLAEEHLNQCFNYAVFLLGKRNYFKKVLIDKLKQKEYSEEAIHFALEKLKSYGYINEERLTQAFVNDKKRFSKKGPAFIANVLKTKGVEGELIKQTLEENYSEEEALENAKTLAAKKLGAYRKKCEDIFTLKGKLYGFLAQRGFSASVIKKAIEEVLTEEGEAEDEMGL